MRKIRFRRLAAVVTATAIGLTACGSTDSGGSAAGSPAGDPVQGGTLRFAWLGAPETLDPHLNTSFAGTSYTNNIVDKLTWQDPETGEIGPWLAKSWEINDTYTEFTFTLREDVTFSDGTPFDAESVKHNLDQYVRGDEALKIKPNGATHLRGYQETRVVSPFVATVVFAAPSASFLQFASYSGNNQPGFVGDATLAKNAEERLKPANIVGTGPFTVSEYVADERTVLVKRPDYNWGPPGLGHTGPAYLDKIELVSIPEASVRTGSLQSGEVDAAFDILPTDEAVLKAQGFAITSRTIPGFNLGWQFNLSLAPTNDIKVREAIVRATDRAGIKETILAESEGQAKSLLADNVPGFVDYSDTALEFDLEESKRLLDEAGWVVGADGVRAKDGKKLTLKATSNVLVPNARYAYESVQATLKSIGVEVELLFDSRNVPVEQLSKEYQLINTNRSRNDPSMINVNTNPNRGDGNRFPADDPDRARVVDTLEKLDSTLDPAKRAELTKAAQDLLLEDLVLVDPVFTPSQVAASKRLQNLDIDATARLDFRRAWLSQES
jgi:peptide/nickel transport system substrate-binding protein